MIISPKLELSLFQKLRERKNTDLRQPKVNEDIGPHFYETSLEGQLHASTVGRRYRQLKHHET